VYGLAAASFASLFGASVFAGAVACPIAAPSNVNNAPSIQTIFMTQHLHAPIRPQTGHPTYPHIRRFRYESASPRITE
jgi:hypothetical protein